MARGELAVETEGVEENSEDAQAREETEDCEGTPGEGQAAGTLTNGRVGTAAGRNNELVPIRCLKEVL